MSILSTLVGVNTFEEIQNAQVGRLFGRMLVVRTMLFPVLACVVGYLFWSDGIGWRSVCISVLLLAAAIFFLTELARNRRTGFRARDIDINFIVAITVHLTITALTGGARSPIAIAAVPLALISGLFVTTRVNVGTLILQLVVLWTVAALDLTAESITWTSVLTFVLVGARIAARAIRTTFDKMVHDALKAQGEALRAYTERMAELTALSGELAHELKNPLASIKGLAGLLDESVTEPKSRERLSVLRREVGRMQTTLEEFLNFSRPLVPLVKGQHSLRAIAEEALALHEGMAREQGVTLALQGDAVRVECDARKVKQVLVNLLQNAIEASPRGGNIMVELQAPGNLRVLDRGSGIDAHLGMRVFEAGVTSKAKGSGIGLTIARALARQHGGELQLSAREGGGTVASVSFS